jgi:hypothetical protein
MLRILDTQPFSGWVTEVYFNGTRAACGSSVLIVEASRPHSVRHTTLDGTPLDKWSVWHRDLYLTTHNNHNRQICMSSVGFEPTTPASERPQIHALDGAATGTGTQVGLYKKDKSQQRVIFTVITSNPASSVRLRRCVYATQKQLHHYQRSASNYELRQGTKKEDTQQSNLMRHTVLLRI